MFKGVCFGKEILDFHSFPLPPSVAGQPEFAPLVIAGVQVIDVGNDVG